jgi:hypothetical protein
MKKILIMMNFLVLENNLFPEEKIVPLKEKNMEYLK